MNLEEFREQLENWSVVENRGGLLTEDNKRISDGKYVLTDIAYVLEIPCATEYAKVSLINKIIREERQKRFFTIENKQTCNNDKDFDIICKSDNNFQPYTIEIYIGSKHKEEKFKEALREAREELCSEADWILKPFFEALDMKY